MKASASGGVPQAAAGLIRPGRRRLSRIARYAAPALALCVTQWAGMMAGHAASMPARILLTVPAFVAAAIVVQWYAGAYWREGYEEAVQDVDIAIHGRAPLLCDVWREILRRGVS